MPSTDEVIERARQLTESAFDELTSISGVDPNFAHHVLDAWYEREQHEPTNAGVDYFRRQAAFHLLLGLTCLPGAAPSIDLRSSEVDDVDVEVVDNDEHDTEPASDSDATPALGIPRPEHSELEKLSRRERRRRG
jgi:hypothetical protein